MERSVLKITRIVDKLIGKHHVHMIVEVGARDCEETVALAERFPAARVYTFECNPATLPLCRERVSDFKKITLIEKAVSDKDGSVTFFPIDQEKTITPWPDGNPGASSLFKVSRNFPNEIYIQNEISVPSVTLASFISEDSIGHIDLLWMDIQGAELMALKGAGKKISDISVIHLEVEFMAIYSGQPLMSDIKRFLNMNGFSLYAFTSFWRYFGDAVFVNNALHGGNLYWRDKILYQWYRYVWRYVSFAGRLLRRVFMTR